ncbi:MAG: hypothetical protein L0Y72_15675 [Gemmataceae bacterium]|nr:hypothetical protein [Gemmataceae bacterium]MCI0740486.1 hypothetical protein [Gemmataceae bacterium]
MVRILSAALCLCACWSGLAQGGEPIDDLLAHIRAVEKEGKGNVAAAQAWQRLVQRGPGALLPVLSALDDANPTARNWLRSAVEAIADETLRAKKTLPQKQLEAFVLDKRHAGHSRRLAYEWLVRIDPTTPARLLPGMLDDPGQELRRDAVAVVLERAKKHFDSDDKAGAAAHYQQALKHARDRDQLKLIAGQLKKLGVDVDLTARFGFITRWMLVGPFDNVKGVGFQNVYPPEKAVDLTAKYTSKDGKEIRWLEHVTNEPFGMVDLNKTIGHLKGAVGYGYTVVESKEERPVEIRAGSNNAVRIFLNGKEVFFREEYHHGMDMDQHVGKGVLKSGKNEILIKVCQNEQTEDWAQLWSFQLRVCDNIGGAVPVRVATLTSKE